MMEESAPKQVFLSEASPSAPKTPAALPERVRSVNRKLDPVLQHAYAKANEIPLPPARTRKRKVRPDDESSGGSDDERGGGGGRKKGGKSDSSKGLRHLTRQVCEKVKSKRTTTYREVANELVTEAMSGASSSGDGGEGGQSEQKTVRRRVYDALNVLMAMGIIAKDKKEIRWIGLPNAREELESLQQEKVQRDERITQKREILKELEAQKRLYRNLAHRNIVLEQQLGDDPEGTVVSERIGLPFLIIHTKAGADINCEMTDDRTQYTFNFSNPFEIHQEIQIIKDMGLPDAQIDDESVWSMSQVPVSISSSSLKSEFPDSPVHRHDTRSQSHHHHQSYGHHR